MKHFFISLYLSIGLFLISFAGDNADNSYVFSIGKKYNMELVSFENYYPLYLADPYSIKTEIGISNMIYADYDFFDELAPGESKGFESHFIINTGVRFSLFKFYKKDDPNFGFEGEISIMIPLTMRMSNNDVIALDGIYLFAINFRAREWLNFKLQKHHFCAHTGDEFNFEDVRTVTDFDPNLVPLPVLDDMRFGVAFKPFFFLKNKQLNILELYSDIGFFWPGGDFLGTRQSKPFKWAYMNYQSGMQIEYYLPGKWSKIGGVYSAFDVSSFQLNNYAPNYSVAAGWILPQQKNTQRFRIGVRYYKGRGQALQFYDRREEYFSIHIACDV